MKRNEMRLVYAWVGLGFGGLLAALGVVLIITGVVEGMSWFAVAAMVLLSVSCALRIVSARKER